LTLKLIILKFNFPRTLSFLGVDSPPLDLLPVCKATRALSVEILLPGAHEFLR
jgi:hypothetical protein